MKKLPITAMTVCCIFWLCAGVACGESVKATEHGWQNKDVVTTRYKNEFVGYNIGFTFPGHEYECDRTEIFEFIEKNGGHVYQGGGYPGAEIFATFDGVTNKETADKKIKEILPRLRKLIRSL